MRIFASSDWHGWLPEFVPECDLLLLGGDYNHSDSMVNQIAFINGPFWKWLTEAKKRVGQIIGIAGNHDWCFEEGPNRLIRKDLPWTLLNNKYVYVKASTITGNSEKLVYGTPWTPPFYTWAFMKPEEELMEMWRHIPNCLDILLSHGPPRTILDRNQMGENCGSVSLAHHISELGPDGPKHVVFGHIHEEFGHRKVNDTHYWNVSRVNFKYQPVNPWVEITDD